jgi:magnesium chelatase family protein
MLAHRLTTILLNMTPPEAIDTRRIHRVAGRTGDRTAVVTSSPCRAPHDTISDVGLIGGGQVPRPGEGSLAHQGMLFLDERPECRRHGLEVPARAHPSRSHGRAEGHTYTLPELWH